MENGGSSKGVKNDIPVIVRSGPPSVNSLEIQDLRKVFRWQSGLHRSQLVEGLLVCTSNALAAM